MLRGKGRWNYYDDHGNLTESFLLSATGDLRGLSVPQGQWHNAESLEPGTVILECKDGKWKPLGGGGCEGLRGYMVKGLHGYTVTRLGG